MTADASNRKPGTSLACECSKLAILAPTMGESTMELITSDADGLTIRLSRRYDWEDLVNIMIAFKAELDGDGLDPQLLVGTSPERAKEVAERFLNLLLNKQ